MSKVTKKTWFRWGLIILLFALPALGVYFGTPPTTGRIQQAVISLVIALLIFFGLRLIFWIAGHKKPEELYGLKGWWIFLFIWSAAGLYYDLTGSIIGMAIGIGGYFGTRSRELKRNQHNNVDASWKQDGIENGVKA